MNPNYKEFINKKYTLEIVKYIQTKVLLKFTMVVWGALIGRVL